MNRADRGPLLLIVAGVSLLLAGVGFVLIQADAGDRAVARETARRAVAERDGFRRELRDAKATLAAQFARDLKALRSDLAAETVARGQQITTERSQRRMADERTSYESTAAVALVLREREARAAAEKRFADRLAAIESLWFGHRCPSLPPLPSKTMPEAGR